MNRTERFTAVLAIIGLVADVLSITTFIAASVSHNTSTVNGIEVTVAQKIITAVIIFYGWVVLSYLLAARKIKTFGDYWPNRSEFRGYGFMHTIQELYSLQSSRTVSIALGSAIAIGVILAPIAILWFWVMFQSTNSYSYSDGSFTAFLVVFFGTPLYLVAIFLVWQMLLGILPIVFADIEL